jgi:hypothetical protein
LYAADRPESRSKTTIFAAESRGRLHASTHADTPSPAHSEPASAAAAALTMWFRAASIASTASSSL